ncbi:MAG: helix-turn-helix transcriptional regulator [Alphaproteobacteria bacterium]|nr:helix-turn-helix transcriptional regulator [Alphaproteobacteria bacterium]
MPALTTYMQRLTSAPGTGHRASRWTVPISVGRYWSHITGDHDEIAEDTVINVLTEGGYALEHGGGRLRTHPGRGVFVRRGISFATRPVPCPRQGVYLRLHPDVWAELHGVVGGSPDVRSLLLSARPLLALHRLARVAAQLPDDAFVEAGFALAEHLLRDGPAAPQREDRAVAHVLNDLTLHPGSRATQDERAAQVGLSRFQLARRFRLQTGATLFQTQESIRMGIALERVRRGQDLTELALSLGYSSHAHFTERFHRHFGAPPSQVRARIR